jgi:hypothetical protein
LSLPTPPIYTGTAKVQLFTVVESSCPEHLTIKKEAHYAMIRRLCGPWNWLGRLVEEKNHLLLPRSEPRIVQHIALYLHQYTTLSADGKIREVRKPPNQVNKLSREDMKT